MAMLKLVDEDGSGEISFEEFCAGLTAGKDDSDEAKATLPVQHHRHTSPRHATHPHAAPHISTPRHASTRRAAVGPHRSPKHTQQLVPSHAARTQRRDS